MASNNDTSACRAAQPCVGRHNGALGFVTAPSIINQDTITEHTIQKESLMAKIGLHSSEHFAKEGVSTKIVMRLEVHKEVI